MLGYLGKRIRLEINYLTNFNSLKWECLVTFYYLVSRNLFLLGVILREFISIKLQRIEEKYTMQILMYYDK